MSEIVKQLKEAWAPIRKAFQNGSEDGSRDESALTGLALQLTEFSELSQCHEQDELTRGANQLARLVEAAVTWKIRNPDDSSVVDEMMDFVKSHLHELETRIESGQPNPGIDEMIELSNEAWSEYLSMSESISVSDRDWDEDFGSDFGNPTEEDDLPLGGDISMLLGALSGASESNSVESEPQNKPSIKVEVANASPVSDEPKASLPVEISGAAANLKAAIKPVDASASNAYNADSDRASRDELRADHEMLDAYLDDSLRCVASMETAALALDANAGDKDSIRAFCRDLHTLKGASATVGLSGLASHLHNLESSLEEIFAEDTNANPEKVISDHRLRSPRDGQSQACKCQETDARTKTEAGRSSATSHRNEATSSPIEADETCERSERTIRFICCDTVKEAKKANVLEREFFDSNSRRSA